MKLRKSFYFFIFMLISASVPVHAAEHTILAQATKFVPLVIFIEPGDTVRWRSMVGHNADAVESLIPEGGELFKIPLGSDGSVTLDVEGVYIYKCTPHFSLGMVGAIVVGQANNIDDIMMNAKGMTKRAAIKARKAIEKREGN